MSNTVDNGQTVRSNAKITLMCLKKPVLVLKKTTTKPGPSALELNLTLRLGV